MIRKKIEHLKGFLAREFEVKDLGKLKHLLGMEVAQTRNEIYAFQHKCTIYFLQEAMIIGCKAINTPLKVTKGGQFKEETIPTKRDMYHV